MVIFKRKKSTEEVFETFFNRFNKKEECTLAKGADIRAFEETFGISFPNDFRVFLKSFGDLFTPDIVDIVDRKGLPICDVQEFWTLEKMAYDKRNEWTSHFDAIPFAIDCTGNLFAFMMSDMKSPSSTAAVHFYNHDFNTLSKQKSSFKEWINRYNELL